MARMVDYFAHIRLASPEDILLWSSGEVHSPRTFNSRSQKPEPGGLFCETIFGPPREWGCVCRRITNPKYRDQHCTQCRSRVQLRSGRRTRMGHIELAAPVVHPWVFRHSPNHLARLLGRSAKQIKSIIYGTEDAETGAIAVEHLLRELDVSKLADELRQQLQSEPSKSVREEIIARLGVVEWFRQSDNRPEHLILSRIPVLPMGLRPYVSVQRRDSDVSGSRIIQKVSQAFSTTDLNELYRRVLRSNAHLRKLMQNNAPEGVLKLERVKLQHAVDALFDNAASDNPSSDGHGRPLQSLADRLNGKHGRFRSNLLGKRVDYSGRAVIIVGPELDLHECGLPWKMAVELFEPFLIHQLLDRRIARDLSHATRQLLPELAHPDYVLRTARMTFRALVTLQTEEDDALEEHLREIGDASQIAMVQKLLTDDGEEAAFEWLFDHFEQRYHEFRQIVESTIRSHPILLNRAPTLHRLGIQAFEPMLTDGKAIRLHPVVCKAFAADFDGDQMAVHVPLSFEAQIEARVLLMAPNNLFNPASGKPIAVPTQDVVLGCAFMTADPIAMEPRPFYDVDEVRRAVETHQLRWHDRIVVRVSFQTERLTTTAGRVLFHAGLPNGLPFRDEAITSAKLIHRIVEAHEVGGSALAMQTIVAIQRIGLHAVTRSGATFSLSDLPEITIDVTPFERLREMFQRGLIDVASYDDQLMKLWFDLRPSIEESLQQGLSQSTPHGPNPLGVMVSSKARGSIDQMRQLGAMRGPVSRMSQRGTAQIVLNSYRKGLTPFEYFASASGGRKALADRGLSTSDAGDLTRRLVFAAQRAVISMEDCGTPHGIIVPTSASVGRTALVDVLANDQRLVRAGKIIWRTVASEIAEAKIESVTVRSSLTCQAPHSAICRRCYGVDLATGKLVEPGMAVGIIAAQSIGEPGTQFTMRTFHAGGVASDKDIVNDLKRVRSLFEGNSDEAKQLLETDGLLAAQRKLVEQLATIYGEQQLDIDDRHLEVIVRQMGRLVEVLDPGGTSLVPGQRLERDAFDAINAQSEHKASCCQRLCGLKRIVQESEGFLAAAGFQDTVNILFEAALAGKRDAFRGLKEHVMVGGLIPAGTGKKRET